MKLSTKWLAVILIVLGGVYAVTLYIGKPKKSSALKSELVNLNKGEVIELRIKGKENTTELRRESDSLWSVKIGEDKWKVAQSRRVEDAIDALNTIKPDRLVSRKSENWSEYQVDSTGTRVQVYDKKGKTADVIIGKLAMKGQNQFYTFVRLADEDDVYAVDNFMGFSIPDDPDSYRDQQLIRYVKDSLVAVNFQVSGELYKLEKDLNENWVIEGQNADSARIANFLNTTSYKNTDLFYDDLEVGSLPDPHSSVTFVISGDQSITISRFIAKGDTVLNSTMNKDNLFLDSEFEKKLFVQKHYFLSND